MVMRESSISRHLVFHAVLTFSTVITSTVVIWRLWSDYFATNRVRPQTFVLICHSALSR